MTYPTLTDEELEEVVDEADALYEKDPDARYDQPEGFYVELAHEYLPEDAPWHQIAAVAHTLSRKEEEGG